MDRKKQIVYKNVDELIPYENNPRINNKAVEVVKQSLQEFKFQNPIIIDANNVIVCGHTRLLASKELGLTEVPCIVADDLTEEQIKAFRIADNSSAQVAEWDMDKLMKELDSIDYDMSKYGRAEQMAEIEKIIEENKEVEEDDFDCTPPEEPKAKLGDIYQLGNHRLMCGDSTKEEDVEKLMGGELADMVFTDPPYNVDYSSKNAFLNEADQGNRIQKDIAGDFGYTDEECGEKLWKPAFQNMRDNAKDCCSIYVTMPQGGAHMMMMMMMCAASWQVKHELIWVKNNHVLGRTDYFYKHEPILYGWAKTHKFYGKGEFDKSVWEIPKPQKSDLHPTMKPIRLIANCLQNNSLENNIVMDLFGGSGSTLIACEQLNRTCYMMELDPKYVQVIIERYIAFTGNEVYRLNPDGSKTNWNDIKG